MKYTILLFLFIVNFANCQTDTNYEIIKKTDSGSIKKNKSLKKLSRSEHYNLRFSKSVATTLSKDFFEKVDKINFTYETATFKKKDTINYVIYDFIVKKEVDINRLKNNISLGMKDIDGYQAPATCIAFFNINKITCVCRNTLDKEYLNDEEFINTIKADTELRLKALK